jgi:Leucine-rich repeat (LRR) protein
MIKINGRLYNKNIERLDLSYNELTHIPSEIEQLTRLTYLSLDNNRITEIPSWIKNLTHLTLLNLSYNQIAELPSELGNLSRLTGLNLFKNYLTKLPAEVGNLTQLIQLNLAYNRLTQLPSEIGNLAQLTNLNVSYNQIIQVPMEIGNLQQLTYLMLYSNPIENILNPMIQRLLHRIQNKTNQNTIYGDTQNVHSSSIQQSIKDSIHTLMNYYNPEHVLTYLDWNELHTKTKEIITEYVDCKDIHTVLNITFEELLVAIVIEMEKLSPDIQKEIKQRLNEEMQESECKCFTGRISRLVNCLSGYSDKVKIQISESEEIGNIISVILEKRGLKLIEILKKEASVALKERGYDETKINEWLEFVE